MPRLVRLLCLLSVLVAPTSGTAVLLEPGDGTQNTSAPPGFPYWDYVAARGGLTAVYMGNGWVLTARHVAAGSVLIDGTQYNYGGAPVIEFENPDQSIPDLHAYRLVVPPYPALPQLPIAAATPAVGTEYIAIGHGFDRGAAISWGGIDGYEWGGVKTKRWGTNLIDQTGVSATIGQTVTRGLVADFDETPLPGSTADESVVVTGDSGGALFTLENGKWVLGGILFARSSFEDQPVNTSLYGNHTWAVDLAYYRDQIVSVIGPECQDGADNDGDLQTDFPADSECLSANDLSETLDCMDGSDNDGDGLADYPADPGCFDNTSKRENPQCNDGLDNDGDGGTDYDGSPADPDCGAAWKITEKKASKKGCGLGAGLAGVLALLGRGRRRRSR